MKIEPEWIEWEGGLCPVKYNERVIVAKRNGDISIGYSGSYTWKWSKHRASDIIAYCPLDIEPYKPTPKWTVTRWERDDQLRYKGTLKACFVSPETAQRIADALNAAGVEL